MRNIFYLLFTILFVNPFTNFSQKSGAEDASITIEALGETAWALRKTFPDSTLFYTDLIMEQLRSVGDTSTIAKYYNYKGIAHYYLGDNFLSYQNYNKAKNIAESLGDSLQMAHALNNLGRFFLSQGKYVNSLNYTNQAILLFEKLKNTDGKAYSLKRLSEVYVAQAYFEKALKGLKDVLEIRIAHFDIASQTTAHLDLAALYLKMDSLEQSQAQYLFAFDKATEISNTVLIANSELGLSEISLLMNDFKDATSYAENAKNRATTITNMDLLNRASVQLGKTYYFGDEMEQAEVEFENVLQNAIIAEQLEIQKEAYFYLARIYSKLDKGVRAFEYQLQFNKLDDQLNNIKDKRSIDSLLFSQEILQQEKENQLLSQKDKALIKSQEWQNQLLVITIFAILIAILFLFRNASKSKKINNLLSSQKEELNKFLSDKIKLENELQRINSRFKTILNSGHVSIIATDTAGLVTHFSKGAEKLLGYSATEMVGKNSPAILHSLEEVISRATDLSKTYNKSVEGFQTFVEVPDRLGYESRVWTYTKKSGEQFPVQLVVSALRDQHNITYGYLGIATDISEHKALEKKHVETIKLLKQSEEKSSRTVDLLEQVQSIAHIGYWELNLENNEVFWSQETKRIHDVNEDYVPQLEEGLNFYDEKSKPIIEKAIEDATKSGGSWNETLRIITAKGAKKWVRAAGKAYLHNGKPSFLYGLFADITEEIEIRKEATKSQDLFKLLAENTNEMVGLHKLDGSYTYVSPACKLLLGYESDELIGKNPYEFFHPDDVDRIKKEGHQPVLDQNHSIKIEYRMQHKQGHYIWLETLSKPILNKENKPKAIITSSREITQRVEMQNELINNNQLLEVAKNKAEAASNSKKQFLATMSHEIRTPLNAINGLSHILMLENPREDQIENLKLLNFSGENLLNLINDILDISKIDSGKLTLSEDPFDLKYLLVNIQKSLFGRAQENLVEIETEYDSHLPEVFVGDSARISQIIYNLVGNAVKFTKGGRVVISTVLKKKSGDNYQFTIGVRDTGIGISHENQAKVFNYFEQADAGISRQYGGTGLGLYISSKLLEIMGAKIKLESEKGKGSFFYFDLQLKSGSLEIEALRKEGSKLVDFSSKHIHVLIVEDNTANQLIVGKFMKLYNVGFDFAENGKEALDKIKSKAYNLVLMDLQMPIMDGFSATREIRNLEEDYFKKIPIIALSADAFQDVKDKTLSTGMNDYLSKPFRPDDLINMINKYYAEIENLKIVAENNTTSSNQDLITVKNNSPSKIAQILEKEADGDREFMLEFAERCSQNFIDFKADFIESVKNSDAESLKQCFHKAKTIIKIFELKELSHNVDKIIKDGIDSTENESLKDQVLTQLDQIISDYKQIIERHG